MVDDVFRSYRNHNTVARARSEASRGGIGDLLAELARLTGHGDPYREGGRHDGSFQTGGTTFLPSGVSGAGTLCRKSTASRRSRHPTDILPDPRSNSMPFLGKLATIRQRLPSFSMQTQGGRLHPAEKIGRRFCRAPKHRRSCTLCRSRTRWTKLMVPITFTMASRAGGDGTIYTGVRGEEGPHHHHPLGSEQSDTSAVAVAHSTRARVSGIR